MCTTCKSMESPVKASCACGHSHSHHHHHDHGSHNLLAGYWREIVSGLLLVTGLFLFHSPVSESWLGEWKDLFILLFYIAALLPVALPIVKEALPLWRKGDWMNEFTLMIGAAVGAFCIGEYPEGLAILLFYSFGERLEGQAAGNVRRRIKNLVAKFPKHVLVETPGGVVEMQPEQVEIGSVTLVKPGERVPIDGILSCDRAIADFDTSAITGESVPRSYHDGEEVKAGMMPIDTPVRIRTLREFKDSSLSRILQMIEEAEESKTHTETLLRRITRWLTPTVFLLALLIFFTPWFISLLSGGFVFHYREWLYRALIFLVCSCPCALVVSIPLSYFAALGKGASMGILFKGASHLESLRHIDTILFDKTGTVTTGRFRVEKIYSPEMDEDELLKMAASLESFSTHPLAQAIVEECGRRQIHFPEAANVKSVPHGICGILDGVELTAGSPSLVPLADAPQALPGTSEIRVAADGRYIGSIFLGDEVKEEASSMVKELHRLGLKDIRIISGDAHESVKKAAQHIGADSFESQLFPEDKFRIVTGLSEKGKKVAFVGDGINDAPSIAAATSGIAMGAMGSDLTMESADVVIQTDNLSRIGDAMRLSRLINRVVVENVSFAFAVKIAVMTLGAFGIASLWAAVFADTGVTILTILWTLMRIRQ